MANDNTALIPQIWANEALIVLNEQMVIGGLVHRDFENEIASFGDTVNAHRPNDYEVRRKTQDDNIVIQDATSSKIPVLLDQHLHTSFEIKDEEQSKSFKDLVAMHLIPAMNSIARGIDSILASQTYEFLGNVVGQFGSAADRDLMACIDEKFNVNLAPFNDRWLIVGPAAKKELLSDPNLVDADKTGDEGTALRTASIGGVFGIGIWMDQNVPRIAASADDDATGLINNALGYAAGTTVMTVDGYSGAPVVVGSWIRIAGDDSPVRVTVVSNDTSGDTTSITISPALRFAVVNNAIITATKPALIDNGPGYPSGHGKAIVIDNLTVAPQKNQLITHALNTPTYGSFTPAATTTSLNLTKNLDNAVSNDDVMGLGPKGNYNFAFQKNALALITRPLAIPQGFAGSIAVASADNLSIRVSVNYDFNKQATVVTLDLLAGTAVLDSRLGMTIIT